MANALVRASGWMRRNTSPEAAFEGLWGMLPQNVRRTYSSVPNTIAEMSPGAAVRDVVTESGNLSRAAVAGKPMDAATALAGMTLAAAGVLPGGRLGKVAKEATPGIRAYHGSPHDFDKFDLSKIGTGEGAQSFGHGLYFAESEPVARQYRETLSRGASTPQSDMVRDWMIRAGGDKAKALDMFSAYAREAQLRPEDAARVLREIEATNMGRMYEVRLNADRNRFLDWDKPLKEQPTAAKVLAPDVDRAIREEVVAGYPRDPLLATGADAYGAAASLRPWSGGPRTDTMEVSNMLRDSGIPGIKYLDQGSRARGAGTSNFVVFDDRIIEIMRKYGWIPGGVVAGGVLMAPPAAEAAQ